MDGYHHTKAFSKEERYALTDQIRRSSRSVCANLAESYRKRQYRAYFLAKIFDADMENSETQVWLDFAKSCGYLEEEVYRRCYEKTSEVGHVFFHMLNHPENYQSRSVVSG